MHFLVIFFLQVHLQTIDFCSAAAISVEPTYSYYEKVSEELEKIVHEVQEKEEVERLSDGEKVTKCITILSCPLAVHLSSALFRLISTLIYSL